MILLGLSFPVGGDTISINTESVCVAFMTVNKQQKINAPKSNISKKYFIKSHRNSGANVFVSGQNNVQNSISLYTS